VRFKNVYNYLITNIFSYLETSDGQSSNIYLNVVHFSTRMLIRHLWQLKTVVFLHWCLMCIVLFTARGSAWLANIRLELKKQTVTNTPGNTY